jgi:hypothetical protein
MKKITLIVLAVAGVALASCKKDRTCTCTTTTSNLTTSEKITYFDATKRDARLLCTSHATQTDDLTPVATTGSKTTCELK